MQAGRIFYNTKPYDTIGYDTLVSDAIRVCNITIPFGTLRYGTMLYDTLLQSGSNTYHTAQSDTTRYDITQLVKNIKTIR